MISTTGEECAAILNSIERNLKSLAGDKLKARQMLFVNATLFNIKIGLARGNFEPEPDLLRNAIYTYGQACALVGMASVLGDVEFIREARRLGGSLGARVEILLLDVESPDSPAATESLHGKEEEGLANG